MTMDLGIVGMAVMGRNLAMNAASKGLNVAVYNRTTSRMEEAVEIANASGLKLNGYPDLKDFVASLNKPRRVLMMVQAGAGVDATIQALMEHMEPNDILVDGGNEFYSNTDRRAEVVAAKKIHYMGMGVSGGELGARFGPSMMPGGDETAYKAMEPILLKMAAQVGNTTCCAYMGKGSAGNYVKMVHNGIEYGDMQLIAECYDIMKSGLGMTNEEIANTFEEFNAGLLKSYLIEITAQIFKTPDSLKAGKSLVDAVLDSAGSKGTGKWTAQEAAEKGVPCPTIQAALDSRYMSGLTNERKACQKQFGSKHTSEKMTLTIAEIAGALYCAKICSYAQGLNLLREASKVHNFDIDLSRVAGIWVGGCIIRADFLGKIVDAYKKNSKLENLLLDPWFSKQISDSLSGWRKVVGLAIADGIPVPALSASLSYFDALRAEHLPLNLVQAQRDCFGAHTFKRVDLDGTFHANWDNGHCHKL